MVPDFRRQNLTSTILLSTLQIHHARAQHLATEATTITSPTATHKYCNIDLSLIVSPTDFTGTNRHSLRRASI